MKLIKNKLLVIILLVNIIAYCGYLFINNSAEGDLNTLRSGIEKGEITSINMVEKTNNLSEVTYEVKGKKYNITVPSTSKVLNEIVDADVAIQGKNGVSFFQTYIMFFISLVSIIYIATLIFKYRQSKKMSQQMADAMISGIGAPMGGAPIQQKKSVAKFVTSKIKLEDVAGCEEEKQEVMEIIDFLKNPSRYTDIGATIPKGILLVGPPGTGKTLLAKAIAGEAGVNFLSVAGSDFVYKFVGEGADRVREVMKQAKEQAPCIIFIDEVDAIGKQRDGGMGGNNEHDQTLNQLLVEMDGMDENNGVIIIAATNRPEILDKAFLRKGRFDRKIDITLPNTKGREEILRVHAKKKRLSETVDLRDIAKKTHGYSGADLYAVLNEAALLAIREHRSEIVTEDIEEGIDRVIMGHSKKSNKYSELERKMVAFHESGHVVLGLKLNSANKIDKVTIVPRGDAGGYAMLSPKEDKFLHTKEELEEHICGLLGGRAAEQLIFNKITTGAHNDLEKASSIARAMVVEYGMSKLGLVQYEQRNNNYAGYSSSNKVYSEATAFAIDEEVKSIIAESYQKTLKILNENKALLNELAAELLEEETLTAEAIQTINKKYC